MCHVSAIRLRRSKNIAAVVALLTFCTLGYFTGSSTLLSFPYTIETITVRVEPHVTVYAGNSSVVNYSTTTLTEYVANTTSANATAGPEIVTFTDDSQLTWKTLNTTLYVAKQQDSDFVK